MNGDDEEPRETTREDAAFAVEAAFRAHRRSADPQDVAFVMRQAEVAKLPWRAVAYAAEKVAISEDRIGNVIAAVVAKAKDASLGNYGTPDGWWIVPRIIGALEPQVRRWKKWVPANPPPGTPDDVRMPGWKPSELGAIYDYLRLPIPSYLFPKFTPFGDALEAARHGKRETANPVAALQASMSEREPGQEG